MASESSFDIGCDIDLQKVDDAINTAMKMIGQRFDFKGSISTIELDKGTNKVTITTEDNYKLEQVIQILIENMVKRFKKDDLSISSKVFDFGSIEKASGNSIRQIATIQQGVPQDISKEIIKIIKGLKLKVNASIQEGQVRVKSKKRDELQAVIAAVKERDFDVELQFLNYR